MILAKKDNNKLVEILEKLKPYILYISSRLYTDVRIQSDPAVSIDDIYSFCQYNVMISIRKYFKPYRYRKSKDKSKQDCFRDGFTYITNITERFFNKFKQRYNGKKIIPSYKIIGMYSGTDEGGNNIMRTVEDIPCNDKEQNVTIKEISKIINSFKHKYIGKHRIHLYDVLKMLVYKDVDYTDIAKKYGVTRQNISYIIKNHITFRLKHIQLNFKI